MFMLPVSRLSAFVAALDVLGLVFVCVLYSAGVVSLGTATVGWLAFVALSAAGAMWVTGQRASGVSGGASRAVNEDLLRSESRLRRAELASRSGNWEYHAPSRVIVASEGAARIYGLSQQAFTMEKIQSMALQHYRPMLDDALRNVVEIGAPYDVQYQIKTADTGQIKHLRAAGEYVASTGFVFGIVQDITRQKQEEAKRNLAANVFTHAREGIMITDAEGLIVDVNATFTHITGYSREEVLGKNPRLLKSGRQGPGFYAQLWRELQTHGYWAGEAWNRRKNGEVFAEMQTISAVLDESGQVQNYVSLFTDITPMKNHEQQLEHIAHFDALTGLPNRVLLADRLQQLMAQSLRRGKSLAVAYLDLDGFKSINDRHGHSVGDDMLIALSKRLQSALREGDSLARIGGDEFVAVLVDLEQAADYEAILARLLTAASDEVSVDQLSLRVSASIGMTLFPQDGADAEQLMRHADQAMVIAKLAGKNRYHLFDVVQDAAVRSHRESLEHIRSGLTRGEFVLFYQPKVDMRAGKVVGAEALIRWQHPERGLLPPSVFLPAVADHPLCIDMGEWVITTALAQMSRWRAQGLMLSISVNIEAHQLQQADFPKRLASLVAAQSDVPPICLEVEILESSAFSDVQQVANIVRRCQTSGVRFALDDFGTGYSSLTYIRHLPAEIVKIDQSFVRDMLEDPNDLAIVEGVIGLATAFRREVIAEGVESVAHGERLLALGYSLAQGYGIARPMPAADLPNWIANWTSDPAWASVRR